MPTWCVRLEDLTHLWIICDSSPILKRVRLPGNLADRMARTLSMASTMQPVQVEVDVGGWSNGAFDGRLVGIKYPTPTVFSRRRRSPFGPLRSGVGDVPTGASVDEGLVPVPGP
jgi:hypothetical protein